jgi:hypothetical protein
MIPAAAAVLNRTNPNSPPWTNSNDVRRAAGNARPNRRHRTSRTKALSRISTTTWARILGQPVESGAKSIDMPTRMKKRPKSKPLKGMISAVI